MQFLFETEPYVKRNNDFKTPSWDQVVELIDFCFNNNQPYKDNGNYGLVLHNAERIPEVQTVVEEIRKDHPLALGIDAHVYMSLSSRSKTFGRHNDDVDVFFWQCYGSTRWVVEGSQKVASTLNPGDIIYIPKQQYHNTVPISARFGISFGVYYE